MTLKEFEDMLSEVNNCLKNYDIDYSYAAIEAVKSCFLYKLIYKNNLSSDDVDLIMKSPPMGRIYESDKDPLDFISTLVNLLRENSHGACFANKVFVGNEVLPLEDGKSYKIRGVEIIKCDYLPQNCIVVLGKPKFELVSTDSLILFGYLTLEKNV